MEFSDTVLQNFFQGLSEGLSDVVTSLHVGGAMIGTLTVSKISTFTSREFNQDTSGAKKAAENGPVFITDRGRPAHVLLSFEEYQKLTLDGRSLADALSMPGSDEIEFEPVTLGNKLLRPVDFD